MSDGRALCLVLFIGVFTLTNTASVTEKRGTGGWRFTLGQLSSRVDSLESSLKANLKNNQETKTDLEAEISSLTTQLEASVTNNLDTKTALEAAISSQKTQLEANLEKTKTALEADIFNLKTKLAAKRCESGYELFQPFNQKTRKHTKHVTFSSPFTSVPKVTVGITHLDADHTTNIRINSSLNNIRASGFDFAVYEWSDSRTYRVGIRWMACSN